MESCILYTNTDELLQIQKQLDLLLTKGFLKNPPLVKTHQDVFENIYFISGTTYTLPREIVWHSIHNENKTLQETETSI